MQLDGLAGGHFEPVDAIFFTALHDEVQAFFGEPSACHAQPEHMLLTAPLGVASKAAGKVFVFGYGQFAVVELHGLFFKFFQVGKKLH